MVEIAVQHHWLGHRAQQLGEQPLGGCNDRGRERAAAAAKLGPQALQTCRPLGDRGEGMFRWGRAPELAHHLSGDHGGLLVVRQLREQPAGPQSLQQQGAQIGVGIEQRDAAAAVVQPQRGDLGQQLGVGYAQLEDHRGAVGAHGRGDVVV